ncbi:TetR/AcrR family transcriptional regulator [Streptomonospora wellingtoniae]|uniref:TetR/AcrR family transcriptional regulator n=1 Tax=Streptomonospora wellingtoniae TaxID=3075544 RepID=A0ABU2KRE0_9ACTN|nr:TetR/AcrR family transcriptional regulator [Streptomonospora sp. DSM 45055]MDT0301839.1 TetR/AcrR family transcriptional regulator [Streptomonospora sp. DSM 45055]
MATPADTTPAGQRILDAAGGLFYRDGINAVGVALVADTAGVTKKTLYDRFGSKDELVVRYLRRRHEDWWAYLEEGLAAAASPRTLALVDAYIWHPRLDVERGCAFINAAAELPPGHAGRAVIREHKRSVRARLADLIAEDAPGADADDLAEHVFLLLEGAIAHCGIDGGEARMRTVRDLTARLLHPSADGAAE